MACVKPSKLTAQAAETKLWVALISSITYKDCSNDL